jgi:hemerythrin-like domain-containing protein
MKRNDALRDLSDDHHGALVLMRRCREAVGAGDAAIAEAWRRARRAYEDELRPHFEIEEAHLLPGLEEIGEAHLAKRIREEHEELRAALHAAETTDRDLSAFAAKLEAHVRFEEREVFEATQERLPDHVLDAIASACRKRRGG